MRITLNVARPATLLLLLASSPASAQSLEVGATIGNGQRGRENALIRTEARLVTGVRAGVWWANRVETALDVAWLDLPTEIARATYYYGCEPDAAGRCRPTGSVRVLFEQTSPRRYVSGQILYHFRRGQQWRPFAGIGFGAMHDTETARCEIAGCEQLIPGLLPVLRSRTNAHSDLFFPVAGVSTRIGEHVIIRGGLEFHRPFGEGLSLFETSAGVGYRF